MSVMVGLGEDAALSTRVALEFDLSAVPSSPYGPFLDDFFEFEEGNRLETKDGKGILIWFRWIT